MKNTRIIELFGGPGCGKSTTATHLFAIMKHMGFSVEYVYEWCKLYAYQDPKTFPLQSIITRSQFSCLSAPLGHVDWIVTDAPLTLGVAYSEDYNLIRELDDKLGTNNRLKFFIERVKPYTAVGRKQSEDEANNLDEKIYYRCGPFYAEIKGDPMAAHRILTKLAELRV